jgi:hypothetical protein
MPVTLEQLKLLAQAAADEAVAGFLREGQAQGKALEAMAGPAQIVHAVAHNAFVAGYSRRVAEEAGELRAALSESARRGVVH